MSKEIKIIDGKCYFCGSTEIEIMFPNLKEDSLLVCRTCGAEYYSSGHEKLEMRLMHTGNIRPVKKEKLYIKNRKK